MPRLLLASSLLFAAGCPPVEGAEEVAMLVTRVVSSGTDCRWPDPDIQNELLNGVMDLTGLVSDNGGVGHSRRYIIGVTWSPLAEGTSGAEEGPDDNLIMLHHAEVRFHFEDATAQPTETTIGALPVTYRVPTGGSSDVDANQRLAVFDLIPNWVARRLAMDRQIWEANSHNGYPAPGKDYRLPLEFRIVGTNTVGREMVSNWYRWIVSLCRGCRLRFSCAPPTRCSGPGTVSVPGNYTSDNLDMECPEPTPSGLVRWCSSAAAQGIFAVTTVCPTSPMTMKTFAAVDDPPEEEP